MREWIYWVLSEAAFYGFFVYLLVLLQIKANAWLAGLLLWALINVSILACPLVRKCTK